VSEAIFAEDVTAKQRYYFLIRRLHSLAGLIPVGVFLFFHLTVNSTILAGAESFQFVVDMIHWLEEAGLLVPVEMVGIFIPLAFHAILGVVIILGGTPNASQYRYGANIRYTLQRLTGVIAFAFILFHVWQMHWLGEPLGGAFFDPEAAPGTAAETIQSSAWFAPFYAVGIVASVYHLANGIWTMLITWGITIGARSQRIAGYACTAFGIFLGLVGLGALYGFNTFDTNHAPEAHVASATQESDEHAP